LHSLSQARSRLHEAECTLELTLLTSSQTRSVQVVLPTDPGM
jgi:hypothetical protein